MNFQRVGAVMQARFREYYRDTASWAWNLMMPLIIILAFAFIFNAEETDLYKVGLVNPNQYQSTELDRFVNLRHIQFIQYDELDAALEKVKRHQLDLVLQSTDEIRYWVNEDSANGYVVERLLMQSFQQPKASLQKGTVSGQKIRYADWLMPGILSMNMMFSCLWGVGWVVVRYRKNGVLRRLQATPLTPLEFLTAQVCARLVIITLVTIMVYIGAYWVIDFTMRGSYLALFIVLLVGGACLTSMGLIVASRLRTEEVADGILNLISWPMMILSGVWFSMEGANPWAQKLADLFPLTHMVSAARRIMIDGASLVDVVYEVGMLALLTVVLMFISARFFRWS